MEITSQIPLGQDGSMILRARHPKTAGSFPVFFCFILRVVVHRLFRLRTESSPALFLLVSLNKSAQFKAAFAQFAEPQLSWVVGISAAGTVDDRRTSHHEDLGQ